MIEAFEGVSAASPARRHPYLAGNFAPVHQTLPLTPCSYEGTIPEDLAGGQYVRNGGNPVTNEDLGRDAHWFDGDGMLTGVAFRRKKSQKGEEVIGPEFVNSYVLTDLFMAAMTTSSLKKPIMPSIATLVNPMASLWRIIGAIFRTIILVFMSFLQGSAQAIKRISVANTSVIYHDGRALALCESGPPMRVSLPGLETVGWFNGRSAEGEGTIDVGGKEFGSDSHLMGFMREWTTAHPRVDPVTKELILFHSCFAPPYVQYSVLPSTYRKPFEKRGRLMNETVPGIRGAKMMHDFGVSSNHTVIMDLPLSLDPSNLARNKPVVAYDSSGVSRFGIFPRYRPSAVQWFETSPCCIFHTANTWDERRPANKSGYSPITAVNMLACRMTSAAIVFRAGDVPVPIEPRSSSLQELEKEEDQCCLYYYQFDVSASPGNTINHQFALSAISFEFPSLREDAQMQAAKYVYGCSVSTSTFGTALGKAAKIDILAKIDVETLIERGKRNPPSSVSGCVDRRKPAEVLASQDPNDPIKLFQMPPGWYAQETQFVSRTNGVSEDDGWLLTYVFDESQLDPVTEEVRPRATSELWIIDARNMRDIVCRVHLPQRVPYGLHGHWFSEEEVMGQRPIEATRTLSGPPVCVSKGFNPALEKHDIFSRAWGRLRWRILESLG